jgi:hypothetical protein
MGDIAARSRSIGTVASWEMIDKPHPFGDPLKGLRIKVTYASGVVRTLAASFRNRGELDAYIVRFHPEFAGKERSVFTDLASPAGQTLGSSAGEV